MSEIKFSESVMQAVLMRWAMNELHHILVIPNSTMTFYWEADLISVTQSLFSHEYEIKVSMADYKRDATKTEKHNQLVFYKRKIPNYFWYATPFDITPPEHAGWIKVTYNVDDFRYEVKVMKPAPRLTSEKMSDRKRLEIGRLLAYRLANLYSSYLFKPNMDAVIQTGDLSVEQTADLSLAEIEAV